MSIDEVCRLLSTREPEPVAGQTDAFPLLDLVRVDRRRPGQAGLFGVDAVMVAAESEG